MGAGQIVSIVFPNPDTGEAWTTIRKSFFSSLRDAGIERHFTFHGLRHTTASHLIMSGVDLRTTAKILGHKDLKMTLRYSHLAPDFLQGAVDRLDFSMDTAEEKCQNETRTP
jgi:site-specific recombinase XerD